MNGIRRLVTAVVAAAAIGFPVAALAEGSSQMGAEQALDDNTPLYVDILDHAAETITWTGEGGVEVYSPSSQSLGSFASGQEIDPTENGAYRLVLEREQFDTDPL